MSTFQAVLLSLVQGLTEFLPVSSNAHAEIVPALFQWPTPSLVFDGLLALSAFFALLVFFRHDVASLLSSFIQVIVYRKRPQSLDERLPFFIGVATVPSVLASFYWPSFLERLELDRYAMPLYWICGGLVVFAIPLLFFDYWSKKNKNFYDWNWRDSLLVGLFQALLFLPGLGRMAAAYMGGVCLNYSREAAAKFTFFLAMPLLAAEAFVKLQGLSFQAGEPSSDMTWLPFGIAFGLGFLASLLGIGSFMKQTQKSSVAGYAVYRILFALSAAAVLWFRSSGF